MSLILDICFITNSLTISLLDLWQTTQKQNKVNNPKIDSSNLSRVKGSVSNVTDPCWVRPLKNTKQTKTASQQSWELVLSYYLPLDFYVHQELNQIILVKNVFLNWGREKKKEEKKKRTGWWKQRKPPLLKETLEYKIAHLKKQNKTKKRKVHWEFSDKYNSSSAPHQTRCTFYLCPTWKHPWFNVHTTMTERGGACVGWCSM